MIWISEDGIGSLVTPEEALISVADPGLLVGLGAFETLKVVDGRPFAITRHLRRLDESLAILGIHRVDHEDLREAVGELLLANAPINGALARLRITVTAGRARVPTVVITSAPQDPWPETTTAMSSSWVRNERSPLAGAKSTSYAESARALDQAHAAGYSEALLANSRGLLCEGTASNVFVVHDGILRTPSLESGALPGITRALVCQWCDVVEQPIRFEELATADEIFLTSSTRDVHPVVRMDSRELTIGPITREVQECFSAQCALEYDPL